MPSEYKTKIITAVWQALEEKGIPLREVERRLGRPKGWLWNRSRYSFDVADFFEVLRIADIDFREILELIFPRDKRPRVSKLARELLEKAEKVVEAAE